MKYKKKEINKIAADTNYRFNDFRSHLRSQQLYCLSESPKRKKQKTNFKSFPLFYIFTTILRFYFITHHRFNALQRRRWWWFVVSISICGSHFILFFFSFHPPHIIICRFVLIFDQRNKLMVCKREQWTRNSHPFQKANKRRYTTKTLEIGLFSFLFLMSLLRNEIHWNVIFSSHH